MPGLAQSAVHPTRRDPARPALRALGNKEDRTLVLGVLSAFYPSAFRENVMSGPRTVYATFLRLRRFQLPEPQPATRREHRPCLIPSY